MDEDEVQVDAESSSGSLLFVLTDVLETEAVEEKHAGTRRRLDETRRKRPADERGRVLEGRWRGELGGFE